MILFKRKGQKRLTKAEKERQKRLRRTIKPSTQNSIWYTSLFENGLMHVTGNQWSKTYRLGDTAYTSASEQDKIDVIDTYAESLNSLDSQDNYQLLVINRRMDSDAINRILFEPAGDSFDHYREEYNEMIKSRFVADSKNFIIEKYVTVMTEAYEREQAEIQLHEIGVSLGNQLEEMEVSLSALEGQERLSIFSSMLRGIPYLPYTYKDIALSGLHTKDFISPNRLHFMEDRFKIDERFGKVMFVRHYPSWLTDRLIKNITDIGIELALTVHAKPYEPSQFLQKIKNAQAVVKTEIVKNQRKGFQQGLSEEMSVSGVAMEASEATARWKAEITEHDQKVFNGLIAVYFSADDKETLALYTDKIKTAGRRLGIDFEDCYYYQEAGLNTLLPIGRPYLDVKKDFMRDMTTSNVATQIPFTNVELQSKQDKALYYGQNQLSNNVITVDRKADLNAANGVVLGSSGSGKSTTVKSMEIIPTYLKYQEDRILVVDPEDEYSAIGREFNGQLVDIFIGSSTHINLLDLPDISQLSDSESDPIGDKSNLLMGLFETILEEVTDEEFTIIDRVTRETYARFDALGLVPTLRDWHDILLEQPEAIARQLALKSEIYAKGSQDIFAHKTNVDLNDRFVIFNLKKLTGKLKPFALMVIQDYIWNQVVNSQGKLTTRIYFDEVQLLFKTKTQAVFFTELYSRIRKYGSIPTAITQNIETLIAWEEGRKLLSNSEFMLLLKHKPQDLEALKSVLNLSPALTKYIAKPKAKGTGLIVAGSTIVPFENPIPKHTRLYELVATDA